MSINPLLVTAGTHLGGLAIRSVQRLGGENGFAAWLRPSVEAESTAPVDGSEADSGVTIALPDGPKLDSMAQGSPWRDSMQSSAIQERLARFHRQLQQRLLASGIDPSSPIRLTSDIFGDLASVEGHPEAGAIEALLLGDPALLEDFRQLVALITSSPSESRESSTVMPHDRDALLSTVELDFQGQQVTVNVSA